MSDSVWHAACGVCEAPTPTKDLIQLLGVVYCKACARKRAEAKHVAEHRIGKADDPEE